MSTINQRTPTIIFIFGGSGDLAYRKLLPALYNLCIDKYLPEEFFIVGIGRSEYTETAYLNFIKKGVQEFSRRKENLDNNWKAFSKHIDYIKADLEKDRTYQQITRRIKDKKKGVEKRTECHLLHVGSAATGSCNCQ